MLTEFFQTFTSKLVSNKPNWDNKSWQQITFNANFNVTVRWKLGVSFVKFKLRVKVALVNNGQVGLAESLYLANQSGNLIVPPKRATNPWNEVEWEFFQYLNIHTHSLIIYKFWRVAIWQRFPWSEIWSSNSSTSLRSEMYSSGMNLSMKKKSYEIARNNIIKFLLAR